ncbi:MAG: penicillin acylase family protein [Streptosporangiaceae bacterium]
MELRLRGLDARVELTRDRFGVPHCRALTEHDAFFTQGFAHATDRLWQIDYDRRRGMGRSAEVIGPAALPGDALYRRVGLEAGARRDVTLLSPAARDMLTAYTAGVNAVIETSDLRRRTASGPPGAHGSARSQPAGSLPLLAEFAQMDEPLQPWEPWHCLVVYRVRHMTMGSAAPKLWRAVVSHAVGPAVARKMAAAQAEWQIACVPPGARGRGAAPSLLGLDDAGSNNWALAGARTDSGLPLLAGDPHRALEVPNVYVQGHVSGPDWDVLGLAIPGVPGFPHFGHNDKVAWCITHAMADDQDLYQFADWPPESGARSRTEFITVRGGDAARIEIRQSDRGPLITDELALAWAATAEPNNGFDALPTMLRARSVGELFDAMRPWAEPVNSLLAADRDGSIGYLTRGRVPVRARPEPAWSPVPAEDASFGWRGQVAFADMPRLENPESGFLFSANNRILAADSGPYLGLDVAGPWRAARIVETLSGLSEATVDDMAALHRDVVSLPARQITRLLGDWAPLVGWDGRMDAGSTAAAAYSVLRRELALLVLERSGLVPFVEHPWNRLLPGVRAESVVWRVAGDHLQAGDESLLGGWSWRRALTEAISRAERSWGGEPWGELHATGHRHPLGRPELDPPPVPYGGDMDTVQASSYIPVDGLRTSAASVARYAFDLADWDRSGWVVPLGAAGDPGRPHAHDQQEAWRTGRLLPAPYSQQAVRAAAEERLTLVPE